MNRPKQNSAPSAPEALSAPKSWAMQTAHRLGETAGRVIGTVNKIQPTKPGAVSRAVSHVGESLATTPYPKDKKELPWWKSNAVVLSREQQRASNRQTTGRVLGAIARYLDSTRPQS